MLVAAPEGVTDVGRERQIMLQSVGQVRVRCEVPTEGDEVGNAGVHDRLRPVTIETARRDDWAGEMRSQISGRDRLTALVQRRVAF